MNSENQPHSQAYFGDSRNYWWNRDFIRLMSLRWELDNIQSLLDVGCGIGHWGQILADVLPSGAKVVGIDPEPKWIEKAKERAAELSTDIEFAYQLGSAEELPFDDASFDMVTCQTVLIHLKDVNKALAEFRRVLKPGGLFTCVEPNNTASELVFDSTSIHKPLDEILESVAFHITCERGKANLGLGYNSIGDVLPGMISAAGFKNIRVFLNDKATPFIPPYDTKEEKVWLAQLETWKNDEVLIWPKAETKKYFIAGGGKESDFENIWKKCMESKRSTSDMFQQNKLSGAGGYINYLISGIKQA